MISKLRVSTSLWQKMNGMYYGSFCCRIEWDMICEDNYIGNFVKNWKALFCIIQVIQKVQMSVQNILFVWKNHSKKH